jgi:chromatin remodeling complex protein RSC6
MSVTEDPPIADDSPITEDSSVPEEPLIPLPSREQSLSPALCAFMDVSCGTTMSGLQVVQYIIKYIRQNNIKTEKETIYPDETLINLFELTEHDNLTYYNMAKYVRKHLTPIGEPTYYKEVTLVQGPDKIYLFVKASDVVSST